MSPSQQFRLSASTRELSGKRVRRLRHSGQVPAVLYGHGTKASLLALDAHEFQRVYHHVGRSHLLDLSVEGGRARKVLVKAVQNDPRRNVPVHVDLYLVRMTERLHTEVPVLVVGESPAVKLGIAEILQVIHHLQVECLPGDIPDSITVDAGLLHSIGDGVRVADLVLPEGVTVLGETDELVIKLTATRDSAVEEAAEEAAAEPEAAAEGGAEASAAEAAEA